MNNDNSLGMALLDTGAGFTVLDKNIENNVPYGTFALTLSNIDYDKLRNSIVNTIFQYFSKPFNPNDTEMFVSSLYNKVDFHISLASKGYLKTEQAHMVTELLVREILNKLEAEHFKITDIEKCMPVIFSNCKIRDYIKDILKRHSDNLTPIIQETGAFEINAQLLNMEMPVYYPNTASDYVLLDLKMYLECSDKTVKECERCQRLFLPTRKSDKYCRLPHRDSRSTCNKIMHITPNDEFAKARNKARDKQHKQIRYYRDTGKYDSEFLFELYDNWSIECGEKYKEFKSKMDLTRFKTWIEETKFTAKILKLKWNDYNEHKDQ